MSSPFGEAVIAVSFVTSFFFAKIFLGNLKSFGTNRKISPEDKAAFNLEYDAIGQKEDGADDDNAPDIAVTEFSSKDRWTNVSNNDKENIPYALFIFWGSIIVGSSMTDDWFNQITFYTSILYAVFRLLHSVFYIFAINPKGVPLRSLMFMFGQLTAMTAAVSLPIAAILTFA